MSCDRAGMGCCTGACVLAMGGESQASELGGGCVTLFW